MHALRVAALVASLLLAGAAACAEAASADYDSAQIIATLNAQREANGIPPVRNSARMAAGCAAYDSYVIRNGMSVADQNFEVQGKPGYTAAGDHAARTSVLASSIGTTYSAFGETVGPAFSFSWSEGDPWDNAAFHLYQMMNPALAVSGADERTAQLPSGDWVRLECLNTFGGPWRKQPRKLHIYSYPRSGSTVAASEQNQESEPVMGVAPGACGPPLTFTYFFGGDAGSVHVRSVHATLDGKRFPVAMQYAGGGSGPAHASVAAPRDSAPRDLFAPGPHFAAPGHGFHSPEPALTWMPGEPNYLRDIQSKEAEARLREEEFTKQMREQMERDRPENRRFEFGIGLTIIWGLSFG